MMGNPERSGSTLIGNSNLKLSEWVGLLGDRETAGWLITVVTKSDLWWEQRATVREYYESGAYHEALGPYRISIPMSSNIVPSSRGSMTQSPLQDLSMNPSGVFSGSV